MITELHDSRMHYIRYNPAHHTKSLQRGLSPSARALLQQRKLERNAPASSNTFQTTNNSCQRSSPSATYSLLQFDWKRHARPNQIPPTGDWLIWLILAGRGFGKTRTGAETIRSFVDSSRAKRIALIGQSALEARNVMVEGVSGLLSIYPPDDPNYPHFESSKKLIQWPNGAVAQIFGADHYDCLRGPQFDCIWMDEFAKFRYPERIYEQCMLALRLSPQPHCIITTTPRPIASLMRIMDEKSTVTTRGTTFDNAANLSPGFLNYIKQKFQNTQLGQQELYAEILCEDTDALWKRNQLIYQKPPPLSEFLRVVVAVDPAVSYSDSSDETGIIVAGETMDHSAVVLEDLSGRFHPTCWAPRVIEAYHRYNADRVVAEVNQGGDLVAEMLRSYDPTVSYKAVHATRGKYVRAEPIAAFYEQGLVTHARAFPELEKQMCSYTPKHTRKSPDRMDALVWALTELLLVHNNPTTIKIWS